jgi:hypothetical protein
MWHAPTTCISGTEVISASGVEQPPVFGLKRATEIFTFSDLRIAENPLRGAIDPDHIEDVATDAVARSEDGHRHIVELLNRALYRLLSKRGLAIDVFRKRCYFERTDNGAREITYQASMRQATRTVTKPFISKNTQKLLYWQHESMSFAFERFTDEWALRILPGYTFTRDGHAEPLHHLRVGPLATRKAARDFTLQVYNHLVFWTWVLAEGRDSVELDFGSGNLAVIRGLLLSCELSSRVDADVEAHPEFLRDEDVRLARLEEQLEEDLRDEDAAREEDDESEEVPNAH